MFPALRMNGLARWLAVVLALFGLAALLLQTVALSVGAARGRSSATTSVHDSAPAVQSAPSLTSCTNELQSARREPVRDPSVVPGE